MADTHSRSPVTGIRVSFASFPGRQAALTGRDGPACRGRLCPVQVGNIYPNLLNSTGDAAASRRAAEALWGGEEGGWVERGTPGEIGLAPEGAVPLIRRWRPRRARARACERRPAYATVQTSSRRFSSKCGWFVHER